MTSSVTHKRRAKTPSFSSILLDSIYRSIDDDTTTDTTTTTNSSHYYDHRSISSSSSTTTTNTTLPKTSNTSNRYSSDYMYTLAYKQRRNKMRSDSNGTLESAAVNLRHAIMIDSWMEQYQPPPSLNHHHHRNIRQKSTPTKPTTNPPKPRSSSTLSPLSSDSCFRFDNTPPSARDSHAPSSARERSSSRSSKFRDTLIKKPKKEPTTTTNTNNNNSQPVSPGARIAAFLNSIFRNGNNNNSTLLQTSSSKREKATHHPPPTMTPASTSTSTCSSASSFSRSCLSKNNNTNSNSKSKRSVRFYPVSVIVDEDSRPCGEKYLLRERVKQDEEEMTKVPMMSDGKWRREKEIDALMRMIKRNYNNARNDDSDGSDEEVMKEGVDDNESCASSDLFELENLSGGSVSVGVSRFSEELPVYATTSLHHLTHS